MIKPKRTCIKVANLRKLGYRNLEEWLKNPNHIYVGRNMTFYVKGAKKSKWANPFSVKKYGLEKCLSLYTSHIKNNLSLMNELHELSGKVLGCWCDDDAKCHTDILIDLVGSRVEKHK